MRDTIELWWPSVFQLVSVLGLFLVLTATSARDLYRAQHSQMLRRLLLAQAALAVVLGVILTVGATCYLFQVPTSTSLVPQVALLQALLCLVAGGMTAWFATSLGKGRLTRQARRHWWRAAELQLVGSLLLLVVGWPVAAGIAVLLLVMLPLLLLIGVAAWGSARRQWLTNNLWGLVVTAQAQQPLADELELQSRSAWAATRRKAVRAAEQMRYGGSTVLSVAESGLVSTPVAGSLRMLPEGGDLAVHLERLAIEETRRLATATRDSETWLAGLSCMAWWPVAVLAIFSFLLVNIIPKFKRIFDDFGVVLPPVSCWVFGIDRALGSLVGIACVVMSVLLMFAVPILLALIHYFSFDDLRRLLIDPLFPRFRMPQLLRSLSLAVDAGQPLDAGLQQMSQELPWGLSMLRLSSALSMGKNAWDSLREQWLLSHAERDLLLAAERNGHLAWALRELAATLEERRRHRLHWLLTLLLHSATLTVGLVVGLLALATFAPLVTLILEVAP